MKEEKHFENSQDEAKAFEHRKTKRLILHKETSETAAQPNM